MKLFSRLVNEWDQLVAFPAVFDILLTEFTNQKALFKIDAEKNEIVVGEKRALLAKELIAGDLNLFRSAWPEVVQAKIRYRKKESPCRVTFSDKRARIVFEEDQEAITPGQSVVCYDGDEVLGGGVIEEVIDGAC